MIGGSEILLILLGVLLLFGADKLPEIAKGLGKGMRDLKKATDEIKDEITKDPAINEVVRNVNDLKGEVQRNIADTDIRKTIITEIEKPSVSNQPLIQSKPSAPINEADELYR